MNRIWVIFAVGAACLWGSSFSLGAPAASTCAPSRKAITLDFTTKSQPPIYNNRLTVAGIRNLFATRGEPVSGPHTKALGVTYVQTVLSMQGSARIVPAGRGFCAYLDQVTAEFGWDRMEVYVAAEYKPGGCEYRTVLDHENQHVAINQATLRENAPRVRAALETILRDQPPIFVTSPNGGADQALAAVHARMNAVLENYQKDMGARNSAIDTASNYDATAQMCSDWDGAKPAPPKKR